MKNKKIKSKIVESPIVETKSETNENPKSDIPKLNRASQVFLNFNKVSYLVDSEEQYRAQLNKMIKMDIQKEVIRIGKFKPLDDRHKMVEKLVKEFNKNQNMQPAKLENKAPRLDARVQEILAKIF